MPRLSGKQTVVTYVILFKCAERSLKAAQSEESGSFYELLNCLVMGAFTVEAYVNHLGAIRFDSELAKFDKKNVWDKYKKLRNVYGLTRAGIKDAYPVVAMLLEFRNSVAHGRTETHEIDKVISELTIPLALSSEVTGWRKYVLPEFAQEALKNVELLITELHKASGNGDYPFSITGHGRYGLTSDD